MIHGVGEQKPGATIRGFVNGVLEGEREPKFFSKPDRLAETYELRKFQSRGKPRTHFFEYYWAHQSSGTQLSHVLSWLRNILLRLPGRIPAQMRVLYWVLWLSLGLFGLGLATGVWSAFGEVTGSFPSWIISIAGMALGGIVNVVVLRYLGDAARYFSPTPENVRMRQTIRAEGVTLLRKLHEAGYGRIVIVGHSLGSVVGYDMIKQLWDDYNHDYSKKAPNDQKALNEVEEAGEALRALDENGQVIEEALERYREGQKELSWEMKDLRMQWRVTDFITAGSPLAHGALFMADDEEDLRARQEERELPTCPPVCEVKTFTAKPDERRYSYEYWSKVREGEERYRLRTLHHAAPFAFTRWTNLYFPAKLGLFGDFIGGPLRKVFGPGVKDVPVSTRWLGGLGQRTPAAHTRYWSEVKEVDDTKETSLRELRAALRLDWTGFHSEIDRERREE